MSDAAADILHGELRDEVEIGDEVEAVYEQIDDEVTLVHWRKPQEAASPGFETGAAPPLGEEGALAPVSKPPRRALTSPSGGTSRGRAAAAG